MSHRRARFRSIYVNGVPVWECDRCGTRRLPATRHEDLVAHEQTCGQPTRQDGATS
ncbi:YgiT-type zinc finger protein [Streptomyces sp. NPDC058466]|uniref:YgiT-type zinc finger protein n=1 Tax=Streptomyces sp. NPDC058466 TaxID=3346512 RepID=UPI00364776FC